MSPRSRRPARRPVPVALCLLLACVALACAFTASAHAGIYKMVSCAGTNGIAPYSTWTNTTSAQNPGGIFEFHNWCGGQGGDPPGTAAHLRIVENQPSGNAGDNAVGWMAWSTPAYVHFKAAGGYTRQAYAFNQGWRSRFWIGEGTEIITQGAGLDTVGTQRPISSVFAPHLWPFGSYLDFNTFVFELRCVRPAGCDRANYNATDLNGVVFVLSDDSNSQVAFTNTSADLLAGRWARGTHKVTFDVADQGSGIRRERLAVDGSQRWAWEHSDCATSVSQTNGEWARGFQPCPVGGPWARVVPLDTATLADGTHNLTVCTQDYGQYQGLSATGGETCQSRTVRVDNTAPGAPSGLHVISANPGRYLPEFGAQFSLPPNQGSPIAEVHYNVVNAAGEVVKPAASIAVTDPTAVSGLEGPQKPGEYRLRVWLEDEVGHVGPAATAEIPRDTTPPAAPQGLSVASPETPRSAEGFDLRWRNIVDSGSPISAARYEILDAAGRIVVPSETATAHNVEAIETIEAPAERGRYTLRLRLEDAEGNVGAPVSAPLAYECVRSPVDGGRQLFAELSASVVGQREGAVLRGELRGAGGDLAGAPLCIFSSVLGDGARQFEGIAITGSSGDYRFAISPGPSRELSALYRSGQRRISATATLQTQVKPTLRARKQVVKNRTFAHLEGEIPGPRNDDVVVVLQVRQGDGWLAFRRYRTRAGGLFEADYLFRRTSRPTTYEMRAQVRETIGYPYLEGDSDPLYLRVVPARSGAAKKCPAGRRAVKRGGKLRCAPKKRCPAGRRAVKRRGKISCAPKPKGRHRRTHAHAQHRR